MVAFARKGRCAFVAQWIEHPFCEWKAVGSNPTGGTTWKRGTRWDAPIPLDSRSVARAPVLRAPHGSETSERVFDSRTRFRDKNEATRLGT